jgi:glc operon protein GlcG
MSDPEVKTLPAMLISYRQAQATIEAAIEFTLGKSLKLSFVVLDSAGHLVAAARMDGAAFITTEVARGKAFACAASGGQPGSALAQRYRDTPMVWGNLGGIGFGAPLLPAVGALPIYIDGTFAGAMGASGAPSELDEAAVRHAIEAIGASAQP